MATKYECDRCGEQYDNPDKIHRVECDEIAAYDICRENKLYKDLCVKCTKLLNEFLKPLPKVLPANAK